MNKARALIDGIVWRELKPPRMNLSPDDELEIALKSPFTAHHLALRWGHHPKLWAKVKGSPFEKEYRRRFNPTD